MLNFQKIFDESTDKVFIYSSNGFLASLVSRRLKKKQIKTKKICHTSKKFENINM